jgi:hypothetical protein
VLKRLLTGSVATLLCKWQKGERRGYLQCKWAGRAAMRALISLS